MGTPPDREDEGGGWQPSGWQSQWNQPYGDQPWQTPAPPGQPVTQQGNWQQVPQAQQSSGKSTAALVLGILGLVFCPLVCSVLALVFGYQARREIDGSGGTLNGRGVATAGIVLGWIGVVIYGALIGLVILGLVVGDVESTDGPSGVPAVLMGHYR